MQVNKIEYKNVSEALEELHAEDKGKYFICVCPECEKNEAFMYKNNLNYVQCNRENQCGERFILTYHEKTMEVNETTKYKKEQDKPLEAKQKKELESIEKLLKHMQRYGKSKTLENGYRGLSEETLQPYVADMQVQNMVEGIFRKGKNLFPKSYEKNDFMTKRNLIFPIYGEDNELERILMRSSLDENIQPKEIQLVVNPSKDTKDFFVDIPEGAKTVVISEALFDSLSFREVDKNIGFIALTGSNRTKKVSQYLLENEDVIRNKSILLALDNDVAGERAKNKISSVLDLMNKEYQTFLYPNDVKDANAFLNLNKDAFMEQVSKFTEIKMKKTIEQVRDRG